MRGWLGYEGKREKPVTYSPLFTRPRSEERVQEKHKEPVKQRTMTIIYDVARGVYSATVGKESFDMLREENILEGVQNFVEDNVRLPKPLNFGEHPESHLREEKRFAGPVQAPDRKTILRAPVRMFRVIGVDTYDDTNWPIKDYPKREDAVTCARTHGDVGIKTHVYDDKGRHVFDAGEDAE